MSTEVYQVKRRTYGGKVQWWVVRDGLTVFKHASKDVAERDAAERNRDWATS